MPDLKAAANVFWSMYANDHDFLSNAPMNVVLAAQALDALAWPAETGACVRRKFTGNCWKWDCYAPGGRSWFEYVADTSLGAILAAMEGERNA